MLEKSQFNEEINAQMTVPKHGLKDAAYLLDDSGVLARQAIGRETPPGIPIASTNSLEGLIKEGRRFATIYAEPPWPCELEPRPGSFFYRKAISRDVLAALPVRQLAAPWADVYLWAPDQLLQDAIQVLDAWGCTYTGSLVWIVPDIGADAGWGTVHQFLLLGVRCDSPSSKFRPRSWLLKARHLFGSDEKPHSIKSIIEQVSPLPRLHLFNEVVSMGWTSSGPTCPAPFRPRPRRRLGPGRGR